MSNRLEASDVRDHPLRRAILDAARMQPGISFTGLHGQLRGSRPSLGFGCLTHHLRILQRHGLLTSRRSGRHRRYYEARGPLGDPSRLSAIQRPGALHLVRLLDSLGAPNQTQIVQAMNAPRQSVAYQLDRLRAAGVLAVERTGREQRYRLTNSMPFVLGGVNNELRPPS